MLDYDFDIGETVRWFASSGLVLEGVIVGIGYKGSVCFKPISHQPDFIADYDYAGVRLTRPGTPWGRGHIFKDVPLTSLTIVK